jgi:hypothetical protein
MIAILIEDLGMQHTKNSSRTYRYGLYKCGYCGKEFNSQVSGVIFNPNKSCGCQKGKSHTHGFSGHKLYDTWCGVIRRCTNKTHKDYCHYGGRGISVCEEWQDIKNFIEWAEETYVEGMSLDRIDNDKGYSPENCRWADRSIQNTNQRMRKDNSTGFVGVYWHKCSHKWAASIMTNKLKVNLGLFTTLEDAIKCRDKYIVDNNLPHKLNIVAGIL